MNEQMAVTEFEKGNQLLQEGKLEDAIAAYRRATELNPDISWYHHHLGEALAKLGRCDAAVTAYRHAIEIKPDFSWSYHHLGDALAQQEEWEESATAFRKAIELNPEHFGTYVGLGNCLAKLGQLDEAIAAYSHASELNPDADWIDHVLANVVQQRNQSNLAEAIASYRQMIELNPDNVEAYQNLLQLQPDNWELWLQLGNTLVQQGKLEEAIPAYRRVIEHNPDNPMAYYSLGECLAKLGQLEEAIAAYRQAIQLSEQEEQKSSTLEPTEDREEVIKRYRQAIEENPDNISEYHKLLELEPDNQEVVLQLAQALVRLEQIEDAIATYRRLVELSPCEEYYQELGELLVKQEKWDDAIIAYRGAIQFNPEAYQYHYQLGEVIYQRVMENPETFFFDYKIAELPYKKDYHLFDNEPPDICFINDEKFLHETSHLDEEAYVLEVYRVYFKREACDVEIVGGSQWLRQGNSRLQGLKQGRHLPEFQILLSRSIISVCLEEAVNCYQRAIELNHHFYESYFRLGEVMSQQDKTNEANATYSKAAIQLAEKGNIDLAINFFNKIPQLYREHRLELVCNYLWKGLNLLSHLNQSSPYCQVEVKQEDAYYHFSYHSQYKVITLDALTDQDRYFLKQNGLIISHLDLIRQDNTALENIYINSCASFKERIKLSQKVIKPDSFQQSIVETGYIYVVDPISGQVIRSNQSFYHVAWLPMFIYRFVGSEVFYLVTGHYWNGKIFLYFPRLELIIRFYAEDLHLVNYEGIINQFKSYMVSYWKDVQKYISTKEKRIATVLGVLDQIGHYLWNDITGIQYLYENEILHKPDNFLVGSSNFLDIGDLFPEIPAEKIQRFNNNLNLFEAILQNNYMVVRVADKWFTNELAERLYQRSLKKCSPFFLQEYEKAKQNFPLLCIQFRTYRAWMSQSSGIANIIKKLHPYFPNLGIVFDGWSRLEIENPLAEEMIHKEKQIVEKILEELPADISVYNIIGNRIYEKIVWHKMSDAFIASMGSGVLFLTSIANKPGVIHGNHYFLQPYHHDELKRWRKDLLMPVFISPEYIVDDESDPDFILRNYDCDWKVIYEAILTILKELNPVRE